MFVELDSLDTFLTNQRAWDAQVFKQIVGDKVRLFISPPRGPLGYQIDVDPADATYLARIAPFVNLPIETSEVRFKTHDFSDPATWDGRTVGAQASWVTGAMTYDDVNYCWKDAQNTVVCTLDASDTPGASKWKDPQNNVLVEWHAGSSQWRRTDTNANVTSSRWRILPYAGYKIVLTQAWLQCDQSAVFNDNLHYEVYTYLPANYLFPGQPAGHYKVRDYVYTSLADCRGGANQLPYVDPGVLAGHTDKIITICYDYGATVPAVIDSQLGQYLDIVIDNDAKITSTLCAHGTFIGRKVRSL
jgi:hypothetical protein